MLAHLPRPLALLFTLLVALVAAWCLTTRPPPIRVAKKGGYTDVHLYQDITKAVQAGKPYHQAAAEIQRAHHYPLKPFVTMRQPTLVMLAAWFGWRGVQIIGALVVAAAVYGWVVGAQSHWHWLEQIALASALVLGGSAATSPTLMALHEYLAGYCIAAALAGVWAWPRRWWWIMLPLALGLAVRELVLPFVLVLLAFALVERRWREAAAWAAMVACYGALLAWHAHEVSLYVRPGDITSQGWHAMQGFSGFLKAVIFTSVIQPLPLGWALLVAALPLLGWLSVKGRAGVFSLIIVAGYSLMIAAFSRPDTFYWGAIMLPWYFVGYVLLPRSVWQLAGAIAGRPLPAPRWFAALPDYRAAA